VARSYDFFLSYTTLAVTPMLMLRGVFFPLQRMTDLSSAVAHLAKTAQFK
jgi:lipooligosaccharide transport system permease protein